jgi:hypothetical protein
LKRSSLFVLDQASDVVRAGTRSTADCSLPIGDGEIGDQDVGPGLGLTSHLQGGSTVPRFSGACRGVENITDTGRVGPRIPEFSRAVWRVVATS